MKITCGRIFNRFFLLFLFIFLFLLRNKEKEVEKRQGGKKNKHMGI